MHFVYIDDSGDGTVACFSALIIPADQWRQSLNHLMGARKHMRESDGIRMQQEIHSTDWLSGKGALAKHPISKERRARLFDFFLSCIACLPSAQLINACVPLADQNRGFQYLLTRIDMNMKVAGSQAVVFCDEGKSYDSIRRKIGVYNYIPSKMGTWADGNAAKNIPTDRILEDIVYRDSARSIFIQAADACAYALLRRERPIPSKTALGLDQSFFICEKILVKQAHRNDQYGIIR
ncbi:MAG: DUF3800 domain-containing protein [Parvibaculaceae bacterium]